MRFSNLYILNDIPSNTSKPDHTYCIVKGFSKKKNDITIVSTFLRAVTVTVGSAPYDLTIESTNKTPMYPKNENTNCRKYTSG